MANKEMEKFVGNLVESATAPNAKIVELAKKSGRIYLVRSIKEQCPWSFDYVQSESIDFVNDSDALLEAGVTFYIAEGVEIPDWLKDVSVKVNFQRDHIGMADGSMVIEGDIIFIAHGQSFTIPTSVTPSRKE